MAVVAQQLQHPAGDGLDSFEAMFAVWCELDPPVGYRAEISEGAIRMNALPAKGHALTASLLVAALDRADLRPLMVFQAVGIKLVDQERLYIPDLVVALPDALFGLSLLAPGDASLVVEITSPRNARVDREEKRDVYAAGGVPLYLLVDPVGPRPAVTLYAEPVDGAYRRVVTVPFGEPIHLPTPFDVDLDTSQFPR
jgi:hypothetical protein